MIVKKCLHHFAPIDRSIWTVWPFIYILVEHNLYFANQTIIYDAKQIEFRVNSCVTLAIDEQNGRISSLGDELISLWGKFIYEKNGHQELWPNVFVVAVTAFG